MSRIVIRMTIDDADHISPVQAKEIVESYPEHERDARVRGLPALGSGRIFAVREESIVVNPFAIPAHWPQINGLDFGWNHPFAAVNLAYDRDGDCVYVCREYAMRESTPVVHVSAIRSWGEWIPCAWPGDGLQHEKGSGHDLKSLYAAQGLNLLADPARWPGGGDSVEMGILEMLQRMESGRWKVFASCTGWLEEFRTYHRDNGVIVKLRDDRICASRYALMMLRNAIVKPRPPRYVEIEMPNFGVV